MFDINEIRDEFPILSKQMLYGMPVFLGAFITDFSDETPPLFVRLKLIGKSIKTIVFFHKNYLHTSN